MPTLLRPEHEAVVERLLASGRYADADEVIGAALHQLEEQAAHTAQLRAALAVAEGQVEAGRTVEWTPALHATIMEEARAGARVGERPKPDVIP